MGERLCPSHRYHGQCCCGTLGFTGWHSALHCSQTVSDGDRVGCQGGY